VDKAIYIAMTGGKHIERAQAIRSNNMANANTTGFRADFQQARAMSVYYGDGLPTRAYALTENPGTDFSYGTMNQTGRKLDVAINGEGWIAVQGAGGKEGYTRAGALQVNSLGQLLTASGQQVIGDGGKPVTLPPYDNVQVGMDGTISVQEQGQAPNGVSQLGRIKLVKPDQKQLQKGEDGLMYMRDGQPSPKADPNVQVEAGYLENSNVNIVDEFTNIMSLARQYDLQV
jgi:flagellar basal-body rod protein FlgF